MTKKALSLTVFLSLIGILFTGHVASARELSEIQHAIQATGAGWVAGQTSMMRLPMSERVKRLGLVLPVTTGRERLLSYEYQALPPSLDWRNNGGNFVTPVRDQGGCGSCWAFATTAALEAVTLISNRSPGVDLNLAEQILVSCSGAGSCNGGSPGVASNFIRDTGLPLESCYAYGATDGNCASACASWQTSTQKITSWGWVTTTSSDLNAIKNALYSNGPLATTMAVYNDFFSYSSGVYRYTTGSLAGYHGVLLVGYDDAGQYFIVKNSWGTWWGDSGYFKIAYSELNSAVGFGEYTIAYTGSAPACSYSIGTLFSSGGGTGSVSVSGASGCTWEAVSNSNWITITSGSAGSGNGTVRFSVAANSTSGPRTGGLTVAGEFYAVSQEGGQSCSYSISPASQSIGASGGNGTVGVSTTSGCGWTAVSNASWITLTSGSSGSGNGTVYYMVSANSGASSRTGTLTIAGSTHTVTQAGQSCSYSISPASQSIAASGGNGTVSVSTTSGCAWTGVSNASWITLTSGSSGSGNGTVNYAVAANGTTSSRTGTVTIAGNTFTLTQGGSGGVPDIAANPMTLDFGLTSKYRPATKPVTISNTGTGPLTISSIKFEGVNAGYYRQTNNCTTVDPGGSCTVNVTFAPTIVNIQLNVYLVVSSNDPDENPVKVLCKGKGVNY